MTRVLLSLGHGYSAQALAARLARALASASAKGVNIDNPALKAMGGDKFKAEQIPLGVVAKNLTKVQQMLDRVGFK